MAATPMNGGVSEGISSFGDFELGGVFYMPCSNKLNPFSYLVVSSENIDLADLTVAKHIA